VPTTQPWHEEFPLDWRSEPSNDLTRAVFIASRQTINSSVLIEGILDRQKRH
jgi:hypothetical protein